MRSYRLSKKFTHCLYDIRIKLQQSSVFVRVRRMNQSVFSIVLQAIFGLFILSGAFILLLYFPVSVMILAYVGPQFAKFLTFVWYVLAVSMLLCGFRPKKAGYPIAVIVLFALWFSGSVGSRLYVWSTTDPVLWQRPVQTDLSQHRTLIIDRTEFTFQIQRTMLAGHVDRLIIRERPSDDWPMGEIKEVTIVPLPDCTEEEKKGSQMLLRAGRTDECFRIRSLETIPDGLRLRIVHSRQYGARCCNELRASVRHNGAEETKLSWYSGVKLVLSYLPSYGFLTKPTPLWENGVGPLQKALIGQPDMKIKEMVEAIYSLDLSKPPKISSLGFETLAERAETLSLSDDKGDRQAALAIGLQAQEEGYASNRMIAAVANVVGIYRDDKVIRYVNRLDQPGRDFFLQRLMERLTTPNSCPTCGGSQARLSPAAYSNPEAAADAAQTAFCANHDLAIWQYQVLTKFLTGNFRTRDSARAALFSCVLDGPPDSYANKMLGFSIALRHLKDAEFSKIAKKIEFIPDNILSKYLFFIGNSELNDDDDPKVWYGYWEAVMDRLLDVTDDAVLRDVRSRVPREYRTHEVFSRAE